MRDIAGKVINLTRLDLSNNKNINDKACKAIGSIFSSKSSVKELILDKSSIT